MDLLGKVSQANALVHRKLGDELGHDAPQRLVGVVIHLELLQLGHQGIPATFGDADGEHHKEGIEAGLFDDHAVLGQVFGDQ